MACSKRFLTVLGAIEKLAGHGKSMGKRYTIFVMCTFGAFEFETWDSNKSLIFVGRNLLKLNLKVEFEFRKTGPCYQNKYHDVKMWTERKPTNVMISGVCKMILILGCPGTNTALVWMSPFGVPSDCILKIISKN